MSRRSAYALGSGAVLAAALAWLFFLLRAPSATYITAPVERGPIEATVTAMGSLNPVRTVEVGTYVSGRIERIDVDFNSRVTKGQVIAKIDPANYSVKVQQGRAKTATARARVQRAVADLRLKEKQLQRHRALLEQTVVSRDEFDAAKSAYAQAQAQLGIEEAGLGQAEAELEEARVNLNYTNIVSPVDGTVLSRDVNVGQTVAASFRTPTLFLIAHDLAEMQVNANVSESDIGSDKRGRRAASGRGADRDPRRGGHRDRLGGPGRRRHHHRLRERAMSAPVVEARDVTKVFLRGEVEIEALRGVSTEIAGSEFIAIVGPSGSGKSTFMNILGCLDRPTSGTVRLAGRDVSRLDPDERAEIRNREIGFVFQSFNLIPRMSALENVELPLFYSEISSAEQRDRARAALASVGLDERSEHHPSQLSGGEQQRVAIARALVNRPRLLLADEPTGNLDTARSHEVMAVLSEFNRAGLTIVLVTHEAEIASFAERTLYFRDGRIVEDVRRTRALRGVKPATAIGERA